MPQHAKKESRRDGGQPLFVGCLLSCVVALAAACGAGDARQVLTVEVARDNFRDIIEAKGAVEAKNARTLVTPRVWPQPTIGFLAPEGSSVRKDDVVVQFESEEIENQYVSALTELELARADASQKEAQLEAERLTQESTMKSASAEAEIAALQMKKLAFVAPRVRAIQEIQMRKAELRAEKARKRMASLAAIQAEDRNRTEALIRKAQSKLKQQEKFLEDLTLRAPTDGIVVYEKSRMTGEKVKEGDGLYGGMPVVKIPDQSVMQVVVQVNELASQRIKEGQAATVIVPSLNDMVYNGTVTRVAKRATPVKRGSKVKQVEVVVEIKEEQGAVGSGQEDREGSGAGVEASRRAGVGQEAGVEGDGEVKAVEETMLHKGLTSGLTGIVQILVQEMPDAFAVPIDCLFEQDSMSVVYVARGRTFEPVAVEVAMKGDDFALVKGGLATGDRVALERP